MTNLDENAATNPDTRSEGSDFHVGIVGMLAVGAVLFIGVASYVLSILYSDAVGGVNRKLSVVLPQPTLETDPPADLQQFEQSVDLRLHNYGWIDRSKGIVHIPIEQAMKEVAERGIPDFPKASSP